MSRERARSHRGARDGILSRAVAGLLSFLLAGCTYDDYPCDGSFKIDDARLDREHADAIVRASGRWNALVGREHFRIGRQGKCRIVVDEHLSAAEALAEYRWRNGVGSIAIAPKLLRQRLARFESVILHELGHSEELEHVPRNAVMAVREEHAEDFTEVDRAECRRAGLCR